MGIIEDLKEVEAREESIIAALNAVNLISNREPGKIVYHGGCNPFYLLDIGGCREYLKKSETQKIKKLVEKHYSEKLLKVHEKNLETIRSTINHLKDDSTIKTEIAERYSVALDPVLLTAEDNIKRWLSVPFETNSIPLPADALTTLKGDKVRSKSELIIANWLFEHNVPYRYECNLFLRISRRTYCPDFTILHPKTLKMYYLEYFGMMSNPEYAKNAFTKISNYGKDGFYVGDKLIVFFESETSPLNTNLIAGTLSKLLNVK